jgi:hypothetical protein
MNILKTIKQLFRPNLHIEYYPETDKYFAKCDKKYLRLNKVTGIVEKFDAYLMGYVNGGTREEAEQLIVLYKEQHLKENVVIVAERL